MERNPEEQQGRQLTYGVCFMLRQHSLSQLSYSLFSVYLSEAAHVNAVLVHCAD